MEVVRRVRELFEIAERLESRVTRARACVDRTAPSVLARAFRGELVPQDPNEEPASKLLERIQNQRNSPKEAANAKPRRRRDSHTRKPETEMLTRKDITQTHLTTILKERGPLTAEALWAASQLEIDDFYDALKEPRWTPKTGN
jgi:type I restriction enzyme S subunit